MYLYCTVLILGTKNKGMQARYKLIFNRKNKLTSEGTALIQLRVTLDGVSRYFSTGVYVTEKQWDAKDRCIVKHPNAIKLNSIINNLKNKLQDMELTAITTGRKFTLESITDDKTTPSTETVTSFILKEASTNKRLAIGTYNHIRSLCNIIDQSELFGSFSSITLSNIQRFDSYLLSRVKSIQYINKRHKQFRQYIKIMIKRGFLLADPYNDFKVSKAPETRRKFLSLEMLKQITNHDFVDRIASVRDMFLFSCYTGLAYKDVLKLTVDDIYTYNNVRFIITDRTKTDEESAIPLMPQAAAIIDKYADSERAELIPIVSNQKFNAYLKEIQVLCNIPIVLTHHVARHTFATTVTLENNVPIETVSRMLGHKSIKTTQIYAKITRKKLADDMTKLSELLK